MMRFDREPVSWDKIKPGQFFRHARAGGLALSHLYVKLDDDRAMNIATHYVFPVEKNKKINEAHMFNVETKLPFNSAFHIQL